MERNRKQLTEQEKILLAGGIKEVYNDARVFFDPNKPPAGWTVKDHIGIISASTVLDYEYEPRKKIEISFTDRYDDSLEIGIFSTQRLQGETYLVVYEASIDTSGETSAQRTLNHLKFKDEFYEISTIYGKPALSGLKQELEYIKKLKINDKR